jgi:hypothetical protein
VALSSQRKAKLAGWSIARHRAKGIGPVEILGRNREGRETPICMIRSEMIHDHCFASWRDVRRVKKARLDVQWDSLLSMWDEPQRIHLGGRRGGKVRTSRATGSCTAAFLTNDAELGSSDVSAPTEPIDRGTFL